MTWKFDTRAIHGGQPNETITGAVNVPIFQTSTFEQVSPGKSRGFDYSRTGNPTRDALEKNLAGLEGGAFGVAYASGMAAIQGVLALFRAGDHVVSSRHLYGGAWRLFTKFYEKFGVEFTFVDTTNLDEVADAFGPSTKLLWLETPSNPLLNVTDIAACAALAKNRGALVVVDNTFATPVLQAPLELGADIVVHSTTKYINGHSDVVGGGVITNDSSIAEELKFFQNAIGAIPGPQDCFLVLRGIKTLSLRVERHCSSAERVTHHLCNSEGVGAVFYPGLESHPNHVTAKKQMKRFGSIVSFELEGGLEAAHQFARSLPLWTLAESLGGPKSLYCHPPTMTHASVEPEVRRAVGISDGLIRLSVGLEDSDDLIEALDVAFAALQQRARRTA